MNSPQLGQPEFGALLSQSVQVTAGPQAGLADDITLNSNPGFETDLIGWSSFNGTFTRANDRAHDGTWSGKFVPDGVSTVCGYVTSEIVVTPLTWYRVSGWVNTNVNNQFVQLKADWKDAAHAFIGGGSVVSTIIPVNNVWTFFTGLVLSPALTAFADLALIMDNGASVVPASNIWWGDNLRFASVDNIALATAVIGPHGESWNVQRTSVIATSNAAEAVATTYRGLVGQQYTLDVSFAGSSGDTSDTPVFLRDGESLVAQWIGGDLFATYTLTVNGWRSTPLGGFRSV